MREYVDRLNDYQRAILRWTRMAEKFSTMSELDIRAATILATADGDPLLAVRKVGEGRTLAFASDISPHWAPAEFMAWPGYQRLFDNAVRWLAGE